MLSHAGDAHSLGCIPDSPDKTVPNDQFVICIRRRLLLSNFDFPSESVPCRLCGGLIDQHGDHLLVCSRATSGARTIHWHDGVLAACARVLRAYGSSFRVEQPGSICFSQLRPDLVVLPGLFSEDQN